MYPTVTELPAAQAARVAQIAADSPDVEAWQFHRGLLAALPADASAWRACIGLALILNKTGADVLADVPDGVGRLSRTFVPASAVSWATMVDLPGEKFSPFRRRPAHWASVRPTTTRFGMPCLAADTETMTADLAVPPTARDRDSDAIDPARPQLLRVFNQLSLAMTSAAFAGRASWRPHRAALARALGRQFDPAVDLYVYGDGTYTHTVRPTWWMPRPYLAFLAEDREEIYTRATHPVGLGSRRQTKPCYGEGLRAAFVEALGDGLAYRATFAGGVHRVRREVYHDIPVLAFELRGDKGEYDVVRFVADTCRVAKRAGDAVAPGDVVAAERAAKPVPRGWDDMPVFDRWDGWLSRLMPDRWQSALRLWFDRQAVWLSPDHVHFPAQVASLAAAGSAVDAGLVWEVGGAIEYYHDAADAFVFPPIPQAHWADLTGYLPGDVVYDLTPPAARFTPPRF